VVEIGFGPTSLDLSVTNPTGPGESAGADGHGIVGMRERAVLLGGLLEAGASEGRFRIRASLPYDAEET
jgi:signal transduction histidine kinase